VPESKASDIFDLVNKFAGYGFNKSHAAAYALVAYQTAYMKANHPVEFMAASMSFDMNNTDKLGIFRRELKIMGIELLGPDINASDVVFSVDRSTDRAAIRYALAAIKNVGEGAMKAMIAERRENGPFADLFDLARRLDPHVINKRQMENLARAGAFDSLEPNRRRAFEGVETLHRHSSVAHNERASGQMGLFGGEGAGAVDSPSLPDVADWPKMQRLKEERESIGFCLSAHPLDDFGRELKRLQVKSAAEVLAAGKSGTRRMAGTLLEISERTSKKGNRYAFLMFEDTTAAFEAIAFSEVLAEHRDRLDVGSSFFLRVNVQFEGDDARLSVQDMEPLEAAAAHAQPSVEVVLETTQPLAPLKDLLASGRRGEGKVRVISRLGAEGEVTVELPGGYLVSSDVIGRLQALPGIVEVREI